MRHDHHQEEIRRRWQGATPREYESKEAGMQSKKTSAGKPSFWRWMQLSTSNCYMCFVTVLMCVAAGYFLLASDGVIQDAPWSERELMIYSVLFGIIAIAMISGVAIMWRKFKYGQVNED